jgi:Ribosome biogenesis protein SLX9
MPKIQKLRRHRVTKLSDPYKEGNYDDETTDHNAAESKGTDEQASSLSRGQKKRLVVKERILRKLGKVKSDDGKVASSKATASKALLSELESTLSETAKLAAVSTSIRPSASSTVTSNKMKKEIAVREAARMKLVQQHPMFQKDPLEAIRNHLEQMTELKKQKSASK